MKEIIKQFLCGLSGHWWELFSMDYRGFKPFERYGKCMFCGKKKIIKG